MAGESGPRWRKRTARFDEIAALAGVSTTTVDRVLNERGSVSAQARERGGGRAAARRAASAARHAARLLHVDVLLPDTDAAFFKRLQLALQRSLQMLDRRVVVHRTIPARRRRRASRRADRTARLPARAALIVTARDTSRVRDALAGAIARGETVVTMVTDIGGIDRAHFAGIDNYRAGRTAGYYIGRLAARPGRVLLLGGRMGYRAHADRMAGCRDQLAEAFAAVRCDDEPVETLDQDDRRYRAVTKALQAHDDVVAITTAAPARPASAALRKAGAAGRVVWIGHEMIDLHRTFIESGAMDLAIDRIRTAR